MKTNNLPIDGLHIDEFGNQLWYSAGCLHRLDGPADIRKNDTLIAWCQNGNLHRVDDGPAIIYPTEGPQFCIEGEFITSYVNIWIKENNYPQWINEDSWNEDIKLH